jgi:hypothetical protein
MGLLIDLCIIWPMKLLFLCLSLVLRMFGMLLRSMRPRRRPRRRRRRRSGQTRRARPASARIVRQACTHRFNPAPGWPRPPAGWCPPLNWIPPADWPPAPHGWQFWV